MYVPCGDCHLGISCVPIPLVQQLRPECQSIVVAYQVVQCHAAGLPGRIVATQGGSGAGAGVLQRESINYRRRLGLWFQLDTYLTADRCNRAVQEEEIGCQSAWIHIKGEHWCLLRN